MGKSAEADVRVEAAGVRGRHLRLKLNAGAIFAQAIGEAVIVLHDGAIAEGLVPLRIGQKFTFGSVSAHVERLAAEDQHNAVPISVQAVPHTFPDATANDEATRHLEALNRILEEQLSHSRPAAEHLLDALQQVLAPVACAMFHKTAAMAARAGAGSAASSHGDGWQLLAERTQSPKVSLANTDEGTASRYVVTVGQDEFLLLTKFPEGGASAWQDAVCRHLLLLAVTLSAQLAQAAQPAQSPAPTCDDPWRELVGSSIRAELARCTEPCRLSDSVLILGETGTGKELVARALHRLWARSGEFVALNCAAIPAELLDAELFGIEPGTATGVSARTGRLEQANGGSLFLDEISELPIHLQSKLLRVLQEREFFRVGARKLQKVDVKIIAASNHAAAYLRGGHMRQDLYFRLSQTTVSLPPLRQRTSDLAALCSHFLDELESRFHRGVAGLSASALRQFKTYAWPGNIRELQNLLHSLYGTAQRGGLIQCPDLPDHLQDKVSIPETGGLNAILGEVEREVIARELNRQPSVADAARVLGLSEGYLYRLMKKRNLSPKPRGKGAQ